MTFYALGQQFSFTKPQLRFGLVNETFVFRASNFILGHNTLIYSGTFMKHLHIMYSVLLSRVLYLANVTNSRKIAKLNPRESY